MDRTCRPLSDLSDAIRMWEELTGLDPSNTTMTFGQWHLADMRSRVIETLDYDCTEITGFLLLQAFADMYFQERSFTVKELLSRPDHVAEYVRRCAEFHAMLHRPEIMAISDRFRESIREATATRYGADAKAISNVIDNGYALGFLRRDALRSMEKLRVDQFLTGAFEDDSVVPVYQTVVHQFWNINSLLANALRMPSGVSLNLIADPDAYQSYFAIVIRNGGNLFVLSDYPDHKHPLQRFQTRRPDRQLAERSDRNWFPYDLLGLRFNEEGEAYIKKLHENGLVPYQQQAFPLKKVNELDPKEIIWLSMMFDLIVSRFWKQRFQKPELSYTGEMVRVQDTLAIAAHHAQLPVARYHGIEAGKLTVADLRSDRIDQAAIGDRGVAGSAHNRWMEERYAARVPDSIVDLIDHAARGHLLTADNGVKVVSMQEASGRSHYHSSHLDPVLHALDTTSFGSKERILHDRVFLGRYNLATAIQKLADEEYKDREKEIETWYVERLKANLEILYRYMAEGRCIRPVKCSNPKAVFAFRSRSWIGDKTSYNILAMRDLKDKSSSDYDFTGFSSIWIPRRLHNGHYVCAMTGAAASYQFMFRPYDADDLCLLTGCKSRDELPDVLQHWEHDDPYIGNSILDRIDPMGAHLTNPWQKLTTRVSVFLSKRALNRLKKQYGEAS